ncbi:OLC1v1028110C1 [Oldenlandia corymbosa var. corymbosa]|uniref:OLC1v1028110C1 n=1 Tax=Oldenlandia corymbosa var. corymbosa TaxID=529605 RepID=A0AAV1CAY7_OLDCO|nr:OLC1v1028110C1 [Oldenlandia corymbosa var. corymbosa]
MELLKLSKFKLQLKALISEVKQLQEKERSASDQVQFMIQKQTQKDEEFCRKIADLQAELGLSNEIRKKLEKKVTFLESENCMLENKQKELKETITGLLQSKDSFVQVYEDSYGGLKREIEDRDRKISILLEKIKAHTHLFNIIEKDANSIKQVMNNADRIVKERDEVVASFKRKLDEVSTWEKQFFEKINNLESQLRHYKEELKRKDKNILVLEAQLEVANFSEDFHPSVDEISLKLLYFLYISFNAITSKEIIIQNLALEKQALQFEVSRLGFVMKKFQDAMSRMDEEDKKAFFSTLDAPEECATLTGNEVNCSENVGTTEDVYNQNIPAEAVGNSGSPECQMCSTPTAKLLNEFELNSSVSEAAHFPAKSASEPSKSDAVEDSCSRGEHDEDHSPA